MFSKMAMHYKAMSGVEDTFKAIQKIIGDKEYQPAEYENILTRFFDKTVGKFVNKGKKGGSNAEERMKKWMQSSCSP